MKSTKRNLTQFFTFGNYLGVAMWWNTDLAENKGRQQLTVFESYQMVKNPFSRECSTLAVKMINMAKQYEIKTAQKRKRLGRDLNGEEWFAVTSFVFLYSMLSVLIDRIGIVVTAYTR